MIDIRQLPPQQIRQATHEANESRPTVSFSATLDESSTTAPEGVYLGALRDARLRVKSPLQVAVEREGDHVICEAVELNEFGFGGTLSEALIDLQHTIAELYLTLECEQERLGPDMQRTWSVLMQKIVKLADDDQGA